PVLGCPLCWVLSLCPWSRAPSRRVICLPIVRVPLPLSSCQERYWQLTELRGTRPSEVGGENVQVRVSTVVPAGCWTVITAEVNRRSSMASLHCGLGQSGAPAMIGLGAVVVTLNGVVPFLISPSGIASDPATVIAAGFWPGGWVLPAGLVQVEATLACATMA